MIFRRPISQPAILGLVLLLTGCPDGAEQDVLLAPPPPASGSGGNVAGSVTPGGADIPLPLLVQLSHEALTLYVPPVSGQAASASSAVVTARVVRTDASTDPAGASWGTSDASRVTVSGGAVSLAASAATGSAVVTARAAASQGVFKSLFVTVARNPMASLTLVPPANETGGDMTVAVLYNAQGTPLVSQSYVDTNRTMQVPPGSGQKLVLMRQGEEIATRSVSITANEAQTITFD